MTMPEDRSIDRREAVRRVSALLGGVALIGGGALVAGCRDGRTPSKSTSDTTFAAGDVAFLDEVADTILPDTKTPGAKAAKVGAFMALMVTDTYDAEHQRIFREGMGKIDDAMKKAHDVTFVGATPAQRLELLTALDREQKAYQDALVPAPPTPQGPARPDINRTASPDANPQATLDTVAKTEPTKGPDRPPHYFRMMKELALLGYFTSEIGATQALRYVESPGKFEPCLPYTPGERAWAPHA
jgi:hypothetical protein